MQFSIVRNFFKSFDYVSSFFDSSKNNWFSIFQIIDALNVGKSQTEKRIADKIGKDLRCSHDILFD